MFARLLTGTASRGGGSKLSKSSREGLSHHSSHDDLESGRSNNQSGTGHRSFDFMRTGAERLQPQEGEGSRSFAGPSDQRDVMREQFRAQREPDSRSVSDVSRPTSGVSASSEASHNYPDTRSHSESGDEYDDRSEISSVSSYNRSETQSIFDHDDRSETNSVSDYGDEVHNNEVNNTSTQHESTNSDNTEHGVENWLKGVYPKAGDYEKHLWDGRNRLRKNREVAEESNRKLEEFLKKSLDSLKGNPQTQQMNNLIIPMAAGSLEQVESKMAPNPRE